MKLATLRDGTRDGQLVVVSRDLSRYTPAGTVAGTMQQALDNWTQAEKGLRDLSMRLDIDQIPGEPFDETQCLSPLPRAYQWADGSAYVNHVELVRKSRGAEMPSSFWTNPLMYQGGSDTFIAPRNPIRLADEAWGIDFEAEIAVVTDDVPMGIAPEQAGHHIKLLMLVNDVSLRNLIPGELGKGFGFFQSKPSSAFGPVAVTPDELGEAWTGGTIALPMLVEYNGKAFGKARCDTDMTFDLPRLISHAAKTRPLGAGCVIGSGTISNKLDGGPGKMIGEGGVGYACIAEQRMVETIVEGAAKTPFMSFGDRVRIEMKDADGRSVFGAIDQVVEQYEG
ncbi:fumarylacetoacetate (FAA) hydrolase [Breoghania corrubedonensis]|uniref:Fumarylacetoacetate (FAA) hydrolase n=1 Tax=Breoghania corrubedonensis TaxID=665038 RepID=A0A2T5VB00_9HYPH|nr:fumarylacetoacetate hydrolase family protein [Breoghania corrubedonensis]PTW60927.1 fumarylacetoacetate (FAA) hydrolase [Breoghania corrubedonensis]